jgi:amino acid transporter
LALIVNLLGLGVGKWLSNAGALSTWVPVAVLIAAGGAAWARFGSATSFSADALWPHPSLSTAVLWSTIAFAFAGLETVPLMGGEVRDPRRTLPRAVIVSGVAITAIYVLGTLAVLVALPGGEASGLAGILQAVERAAARVGWSGLSPLVALMVAIGAIGGTSAWLAATARLPFVAGIDHYLPDAFGRLHPRWGTPHVSLLVQTAGAAVFVVLGQAGAGVREAYDALVAIGVLTYFLPYLAMFAAWIRLRRAAGAAGRAPGPVLIAAGLGLLTTAASLVLAMLPPADSPHPLWVVLKVSGGSLAMVLVGCAIYAAGRRHAAARRVPAPRGR